MTYYTTIGLEIHAELKTASKMFCGCVNNPDENRPNHNVCPICMAHPGTLPVVNKEAVRHVVAVGYALGGTIADFTEFDRKNYFYPDIPKGYQISQYKYPLITGGALHGVAITRIHLEEDTGTSKHDRGEYSLVDYNRAGVPLMELVTEPCIHTPEQAGAFGRELQLLLQYLGVAEANMEKGEMRVELNISISPDPTTFGTKVEVKNINSFKAVERAARYEIARMQSLYEAGKENEIVQETRGWDENKGVTFSQRSKENAHDYRYFPDPDIPKFKLSELFSLEQIKASLPETPDQRRARYQREYQLHDDLIEVFIADRVLAGYFEAVAVHVPVSAYATTAHFVTSDIQGLRNTQSVLPDAVLVAELITLFAEGKLSSRTTKELLPRLIHEKVRPAIIAEKEGLLQSNDSTAFIPIVEQIIAANEKVVLDYKGGKEAALMFFVGQLMKETKGKVHPDTAKALFIEYLQK